MDLWLLQQGRITKEEFLERCPDIANPDEEMDRLRQEWGKCLADLIATDPTLRDMTPARMTEVLRETEWYKSRAKAAEDPFGLRGPQKIEPIPSVAELDAAFEKTRQVAYDILAIQGSEMYLADSTQKVIAVIPRDGETIVVVEKR